MPALRNIEDARQRLRPRKDILAQRQGVTNPRQQSTRAARMAQPVRMISAQEALAAAATDDKKFKVQGNATVEAQLLYTDITHRLSATGRGGRRGGEN